MQRRHRSMPCVIRRGCLLFLAVCASPPAAGGPVDAEAIRRVRGIIDRDEAWSGHVIITDDVTVLGATLSVEPGALVEFAVGRPGDNPVLTIGGEGGRPAMLQLAATPESPIVFRTAPGTQAGRIIAWLGPSGEARASKLQGPGAEPAAGRPAPIQWHFVRFEGLGFTPESDASTRPADAAFQPAVDIRLGAGARIELSDCEFSRCGQLSIELDDGTRATLSNNQITAPLGTTALHLRARAGDEPASIHLAKNRVEAAVIADGVAGLILENVLIGPRAALILSGRTTWERTVRGNYVHTTAPADDGRYCFTSDDPGALVEGNIFRGGSTCVFMGVSRMFGNVLIGAPNLRSARASHSQTHQLVAALPPGAVFANNLLIGPAYSMLIPQPLPGRASATDANSETLIRNNAFDGLDGVGRGVHVNASDRAPARVRIEDNVFLRVGAVVFDEPGRDESHVRAAHNACAPWPAGLSLKSSGTRAGDSERLPADATDILSERIADFRLRGEPPERIPDFDGAILDGRTTIDRLRREWFGRYRPLEGSPLLGAGVGRRDRGGRTSIGPDIADDAVETRDRKGG